MKKRKNIILQYIEYYLARIVATFIRIIPLKVAFFLAKIIGILGYYIDYYDRRLMIQHLLHAGVAPNKKEASILAKENYIHMLKLGVEFLRFDQYFTSEKDIQERIKVKPFSKEVEEAFKNAKAIIFVGGHIGNWEMSGLYCSAFLRPLLSVMSPISNEKITDYMLKKREKFNQEICMKKNSFKLLLDALKTGRSVGLIADEHAGHNGVETMFFGHPAKTHISPALLHLRTGAPIIVGFTTRAGDNFTYDLRAAEKPIKLEKSTGTFEGDIQFLAQQYTAAIEEEVRRKPAQWIWCHKRWMDINREKRRRKKRKKKSNG